MFDKKSDVDRHVETCLRKINSEKERNLRSLAFAKLYLNVGEAELARRYVSGYLSAKPNSAEAHRLLGSIYEKLGRREQALEEYRLSLDLDSKQSGLILKVCELLAQDDVVLEPTRARYWCEQAQLLDPQNQAVFNLKERLISSESKSSEDLQKLFLSELEHRPTDINLRVRLLNYLLQNNQINEAFKHVSEIEAKNLSIFSHHFSWYETIVKVLIRYKNEYINSNILNSDFWILFISALEKLAFLSMDENSTSTKSLSEVINNVFNFDQMLQLAFNNVNESKDKQYVQEFLTHFKAQLCFHLSTIVFKQAKKDQITYKEAINLVIPLLFISYHTQPADTQSVWLDHTSEKNRTQIEKWLREGSFRCSQSGHILLSLVKGRRSNFLDKATQLSSGNWKEKTFKNIFITRDQQLKIKSSFFITIFSEDIIFKLPENSDLRRHDEIAQQVFPDSLHHIIWLGLNSQLPKFHLTMYDGLQFSVKNLNNCAAESLNVLDIEAFVYCCIFCTQMQIEDSKHVIYYNQDKPAVLPAIITETFGTINQTKWYSSVYKMYKNVTGTDVNDVRITLIKGIETIRCAGSHGLDAKLLVLLSNTFAQKAKLKTKQNEFDEVEIRAELYWRSALPLLEKLRNNQIITYPSKRWFEYKGKEMTPTEISINIEEGKLFTATQLMKKKSHEKALQMLENLRSPYASFYQAQTYKLLADEQMSHNKENVTSEMRSQHIILLSKSRDCLYLTLDRLREPSVDRKHPLNAQLGTEIEKIERLLSRIDPDICGNRNECDMSEENVSSVESVENNNLTSNYHSFHNGNMTPRHATTYTSHFDNTLNNSRRIEARPSPERLDAQLRQMAATKDAAVSHILEQNKIMVQSHQNLVEELRNFKDAVTNLTSSVDDLKGIKKSVEDLKIAVDDLQSLKETVEQVQEIKKDLAELKKDTSKLKGAQIDEDLFALEDEYNDYNLGNTASGFNSAAFYPNFPQRLQGNTLAYGTPGLYGMYPMYPYGGLGLTQPGTLPFPDSQLPDFRTMGSIGQGLSHTGLAQTPVTMAQPINIFPKFDPNLAQIGAQLTRPVMPSTSFPVAPQISTIPAVTTSALPVNVVITTSDPLPTTSTTQPILSVTIPPQHLKGNKKQPHNYQIPLPNPSQPLFSAVATMSAPLPVSTQSLLSNVAPPVFSSLSIQNSSQNQYGALDKSGNLNVSQKSDKANRNNSNVSDSSVIEEHDPCPDFKPIIPLPDEIHVTTGEENENILFCERAKLYRYVEKEWKERGLGNIKILHNEDLGKVRIIMRREQVHKLCANHFLTTEMTLTPMHNTEQAFIWAAHDFADENIILEKFCVRFKTHEIANKFKDIFNHAKTLLKNDLITEQLADSTSNQETKTKQPEKAASLGGFMFTSTPTFKPKTPTEVTELPITNVIKSSPFANFTFEPKIAEFKPVKPSETPKNVAVVKLNENTNSEDFVPTAEFKPVVPLPELIEVKTGEENSDVLYEVKAKLLRFDSDTKEWKERGIGIMKILKEEIIRLVMRREQIHKVCCNHQLLTSMVFTNMPKNEKVLNWCAQDYSENILKTEMFAIRFRTAELCEEFLNEIHKAQRMLDSANYVISKSSHLKLDTKHDDANKPDHAQSPQRFKPSVSPQPQNVCERTKKIGTWQCKTCFIHNDGKKNYCEACDTPKNDSLPLKDDKDVSGDQFSFGISSSFNSTNTSNASYSFSQQNTSASWDSVLTKQNTQMWSCTDCYTSNENLVNSCMACGGAKPGGSEPKETAGFGEKFKPKQGSWDCKSCYLNNISDALICVACNSPKENQKMATPILKTPVTSSWGDQFKPKSGSWNCTTCYINNQSDTLYCVACNNPKDDTVPKKSEGADLSTNTKFLFGVQPTEQIFGAKSTASAGFTFGTTQTKTPTSGFFGGEIKPPGFTFGTPKTDSPLDLAKSGYTFGTPKTNEVSGSIFGTPKSIESTVSIFGTPITAESTISMFGTPITTESSGFSFGTSKNDSTYGTPITSDTSNFSTKTDAIFNSLKNTPNFGAQKTTELNLTSNIGSAAFNFSMPIKTDTEKKDGFVFGSPNKYEFEFKPRSPRKHSENQESEGSDIEDEGEHIYFKPVIPLPDKVEVKTGEESEEVLYYHRAKLYRFVNGEWKERGIGDIKILRHTTTGKLRVVMRREQILKICLNHALTNDIEYASKDDKTWLFSCADYSDGEIKVHQFCLRFKNAEIAIEFKNAVDKARSNKPSPVKSSEQQKSEESDDDVIIVSETKVTPEEQKKALDLMLPKNFYAYLQKPPCPGCIGCNPDDFVFDTPKTTSKKLEKITVTEPLISTPKTSQTNMFAGAKTPVTFSFMSQVTTTTQTKPPLAPPKLNTSTSLSTDTTPKNMFSGSNIFGNPPNKPSTDTPIFSIPKTGSIFDGTLDQTPKTSIFGGIPNDTPKTGNIFGGKDLTPKPSENIFGQNTNIFGPKSDVGSTRPVFGTQNKSDDVKSTENVFGAQANIFGPKSDVSSTSPVFGGQVEADEKAPIFGSSGPSFGSLAQQSVSFATLANENKNFAPNDASKSFMFEGAGAPVFGTQKSKNDSKLKLEDSKDADESHEDVTTDENYDPHYEPIVPLPDAIVVKTGEEDEEVLFIERCKLFRFTMDGDKGEWKERGIGQIKILYHPVNVTYRLLMRREQVHKLVLNQLITPDLELQPMSSSDRAWLWCGVNYSDEGSQLEKLAVRFKNPELADKFRISVNDAVAKVQVAKEAEQSSETLGDQAELDYGGVQDLCEVNTDEAEHSGVDDYEVEHDDEEYGTDDSDETRSQMFSKRCTLYTKEGNSWKNLGMGELKIYYDADLYGSRIAIYDDHGVEISNTIVALNTEMDIKETTCTWRATEWAIDPPAPRILKAQFASSIAAQEMHYTYSEALTYAQQCEIVDQLSK